MCAHSTIKLAYKILKTRQPTFLFEQILMHKPVTERPRRMGIAHSMHKLTISRESLVPQAAKLFYSLPEEVQENNSSKDFKRKTKEWVMNNIPIYM